MFLTNEILIIKQDFMTSAWRESWGQPRSSQVKPHKNFILNKCFINYCSKGPGLFPPNPQQSNTSSNTEACTCLYWHFNFLYLFPHRRETSNSRTGYWSAQHVGLESFEILVAVSALSTCYEGISSAWIFMPELLIILNCINCQQKVNEVSVLF